MYFGQRRRSHSHIDSIQIIENPLTMQKHEYNRCLTYGSELLYVHYETMSDQNWNWKLKFTHVREVRVCTHCACLTSHDQRRMTERKKGIENKLLFVIGDSDTARHHILLQIITIWIRQFMSLFCVRSWAAAARRSSVTIRRTIASIVRHKCSDDHSLNSRLSCAFTQSDCSCRSRERNDILSLQLPYILSASDKQS